MSWIEGTDASSLYDLDVDQSFYNVTSKYGEPLYIYSLLSECVKCPYAKLRTVEKTHGGFAINSAHDYSLRIFDVDQGQYTNVSTGGFLCEFNQTSAEFGVYDLLVHTTGRCTIKTIYEPVNIIFREFLSHNFISRRELHLNSC